MTVSRASIDRYFDIPVPYMPALKGASVTELQRSIYDSTGATFNYKTAPRGNYQLECLAFALYLRRALLYVDPQLGKTWIALNWAEHLLRSKLWRKKKGLVIAHSPLGLDVWQDQAEQHSDLTVWPVRIDFNEFCDAMDSDVDLIVVPFSGLQSMFTQKGISRKGKAKLYPDLKFAAEVAPCFELCIVDEIHMAMHHDTIRFKLAAELTALCDFRLGLSGTPYGRDPYAVWAQAFLIDRGTSLGFNYYFFQEAFGKPRRNFFSGRTEFVFDKGNRKTKDPGKMPWLDYKLSQIAMVYRRSECADDVVFSGVTRLKMRGDQLQAYQDAINNLIRLPNDKRIEIRNQFVRLRQIASGYLPFDDDADTRHVLHFSANPKLQWLHEFIEALNDEVTIIIFHEFTHSGQLISDMLTKLNVTHGWLWGGAKQSDQIVADFKAGKFHVLVSNSAKGGVSISLPMADYILFFESPCSPITRRQAESRPAARGSRPLIIDDLICSGVEQRICDYITEGRDLMAALARERRNFADARARKPARGSRQDARQGTLSLVR